MVVIASIREEGGAFVGNQRRHVETGCLDVEIARQRRVADAHVDVADAEAGGRRVGQLAISRQSGNEVIDVQLVGPHLHLAIGLPCPAFVRPVGIDFDDRFLPGHRDRAPRKRSGLRSR